MTISAPALANKIAVAAPIPLLPPVTTATLLCNGCIIRPPLFCNQYTIIISYFSYILFIGQIKKECAIGDITHSYDCLIYHFVSFMLDHDASLRIIVSTVPHFSLLLIFISPLLSLISLKHMVSPIPVPFSLLV